jgi:chemotaxis protein methyltransferase CheR
MAIMLAEEGLLERTIIYATDINPEALRKAESGIYEVKRMAQFCANYQRAGGTASLSDYCTTSPNGVLLDRSLHRHLVFADHSLATDSVFSEVHFVSCRNVLIYFDRALQDRAIDLFTDSLVHRGFLGLGSRESLRFSRRADAYVEFVPDERIYRRT